MTRLSAGSYDIDRGMVRRFTQETGITVKLVPSSESVSEQLTQEMDSLEHASRAVDVFQIDVTWPAIVGEHMIDLRGPLGDELLNQLPGLIENATIKGRVVAAPFFADYGLLYYRRDLLSKYGFSHAPRTWDELEHQASRIQAGERRAGHPDFWGYVWQGAEYEGLTCNALEWQYSQGGGNMLQPDHTVSVDNPASVRAFRRAARWVGTISPPAVTAYMEEDSRNLWQRGRAAFLRSWSYVYPLAKTSGDIGQRFSVALLPAGSDPHSSVLGGWYLGVSKYSEHRQEAITFVKYMIGIEAQRRRAMQRAFLPSIASLYNDPGVIAANPLLAAVSDIPNRIVRRPASLAGAKYDGVSRAYAHGVHQILSGKTSAEAGAAEMQKELVRITGFPVSTPRAMGAAAGTRR